MRDRKRERGSEIGEIRNVMKYIMGKKKYFMILKNNFSDLNGKYINQNSCRTFIENIL